ncbi:MAG TPA: glycosyltransferase family 2 protein [Burkholderiales bacterium]|nr:glycosyltransferase family 2 protein [Burkholderiales bacterium]
MTSTSLPIGVVPSWEDYSASATARQLADRGERISRIGDPETPLVSIVTIVRNGEVTLQRAMQSVLSQDFASVEYLIVDGGSTDASLQIVRRSEDRLAIWISEPDAGISDAFNKGIVLARGEIIGLLNSDDWYEPGAISAIVQRMTETGADIACGGLQYWEGGRRTYLVGSNPAKLARGMTVGHPTVFVRRDSYRRFGLFRLDFRLAMDYEWLLRAKSKGATFVVLDRCLANMQGGGIGDRRWRDSQREVARARALHIAGADNWLVMWGYVVRRIFVGSVRRVLDFTGLGAVRRVYHRWLSPIKITSGSHDGDNR